MTKSKARVWDALVKNTKQVTDAPKPAVATDGKQKPAPDR
jgi:hypothetical protein